MTREEIETILAQRLEAWHRHDAAALTAGHSEDSVYTSAWVGTIQGQAAIKSLYTSWFSAFPEAVFEVENQVIDGNRTAISWKQTGRHMGEFCGLEATGRIFQLRGAFFYVFKDGKIVYTESIYDITGLMVQVGVLKAKPAH